VGTLSAAGKRWMGWVAELPCVLCEHIGYGRVHGVQVHHIRDQQGLGQRAPDTLTLPLCPEHHQGDTGYHGLGKREFERRYKVTEYQLLARALEWLADTIVTRD
jgi:hypothetical protein